MNPDAALIFAAERGLLLRIHAAICRGATKLDDAMWCAAREGRMNAMLALRDLGADNFDCALEAAASGGRTGLMKILKNCGASQFNTALATAAEYGQDEAIRLLHSWGASRLEWAVLNAAKGRSADAETLDLIYSLAGRRVNTSWLDDSLVYATITVRYDKVLWLIRHGASDSNRAMTHARNNGDGMFTLFQDMGARKDPTVNPNADFNAMLKRLQKIWDAQMAIDARRGHHDRLVTLALVLAPFGLSVYEELWIFAWAAKGPLPESRCLRILDRVHAGLA